MVACSPHSLGRLGSGRTISQTLLYPSAIVSSPRPFTSKRTQASRANFASRAKLQETDNPVTVLSDTVERLEDTLNITDVPRETLPGMSASSMQKDTASQRRRAAKARHQLTYKVAAISASLGVTSLAILAVHYRFAWHMENGGDVPWLEAALTILLTLGGVIGMEMWARWAHKALWHDFAPGWALHESHHKLRVGPFESNDVFAIVNAVPAIALLAYGFFTPTIAGGLAFGGGLGITLFGMMYMFVHDGLVHKRFPVGPLADVPYLRRVAAAHKLHHAEKYNGVPWGLFLGPQELEAAGGKKELDFLCRQQETIAQRKAANK